MKPTTIGSIQFTSRALQQNSLVLFNSNNDFDSGLCFSTLIK